MKALPSSPAAERRALLEEYLLVCAQSRSRESALEVLASDLKVVGKKLGLHGTRAAVFMGAEKLSKWLEGIFKE